MTFSPVATHSYLNLPKLCYEPCAPTSVKAPQWVAFNQSLAQSLNIPQELWLTEHGLQCFSGNQVPEWSKPVAQAYAGHQFGHFNPRLGDGRAILLSELTTTSGQRVEIQLKGAGRTPYSRGGDGRSPLGPVLREYIVSEAMHNLGIPTTRALAAIVTGDHVYREHAEPGAVLTRIASSHLRIGSVQFVRAHGSTCDLTTLLDFITDRHYPALKEHVSPYLGLLDAIIERQLELAARWMSIGFIHGVMNTDNTSLSGETIDYGPCAFMENYNPSQTFSYIDKRGRYAYNHQPDILQWNLTRLAESMLPVLKHHDIDEVNALLNTIPQRFASHWLEVMSKKVGIVHRNLDHPNAEDSALINQLLATFEHANTDFTLGFRHLADEVTNSAAPQQIYKNIAGFTEWRDTWQSRLRQQSATEEQVRVLMNQTNPARIPRNHRIQEVITAAYEDGDLRPFQQLQAALASPYQDDEQFSDYSLPALAEQAVTTTFCGT